MCPIEVMRWSVKGIPYPRIKESWWHIDKCHNCADQKTTLNSELVQAYPVQGPFTIKRTNTSRLDLIVASCTCVFYLSFSPPHIQPKSFCVPHYSLLNTNRTCHVFAKCMQNLVSFDVTTRNDTCDTQTHNYLPKKYIHT